MPYFEESKGCRSWWQSRTGLEQKLVILSTILFILSFSLTISVIVLKNRTTGGCDTTTISPTTVTEDVSTVSGETPVTEPSPTTSPSDGTPSSSASTKEEPVTSESTPVSTPAPTTTSTEATTKASSTETPSVPPAEGKNAGPGSITARSVRFNSKGFANLNGNVLGA